MKHVLGLIVGLAAGSIAAAALIYFNPLTRNQNAAATNPDWTFNYSLAAGDTWLSTHSNRIDLPVVPADIPSLWETGIKGTLLAAMPLTGGPGASRAAGTRISVPSVQSELIRSGILVDDFWLISVPGEGSVVVHAVNNQWPLLRDTLVRVDWLGRNWAGPGEYGPTRRTRGAQANVVGLTGEFVGIQGRVSEQLALPSYAGNLAALSGRLSVVLADAEH